MDVLPQETSDLQPSISAITASSMLSQSSTASSNWQTQISSQDQLSTSSKGLGTSTISALPNQGAGALNVSSSLEPYKSRTTGISVTTSGPVKPTSHTPTGTSQGHEFRSRKAELIGGIIGGISICLITIFLLRYLFRKRVMHLARNCNSALMADHIPQTDKSQLSEISTIISSIEESSPYNNGVLERYVFIMSCGALV